MVAVNEPSVPSLANASAISFLHELVLNNASDRAARVMDLSILCVLPTNIEENGDNVKPCGVPLHLLRFVAFFLVLLLLPDVSC